MLQIRNYIKLREKHRKTHKRGLKRDLSNRNENHVRRLASNQMISWRIIKADLGLTASKIFIWRYLNRTSNITHRKLKRRPMLPKLSREKLLNGKRLFIVMKKV